MTTGTFLQILPVYKIKVKNMTTETILQSLPVEHKIFKQFKKKLNSENYNGQTLNFL